MPGDDTTSSALTLGAYNYERFDAYVESGTEAVEFGAFPGHLHAGGPAPDFAATALDSGSEVRLSDLWRGSMVVMEFGSYT